MKQACFYLCLLNWIPVQQISCSNSCSLYSLQSTHANIIQFPRSMQLVPARHARSHALLSTLHQVFQCLSTNAKFSFNTVHQFENDRDDFCTNDRKVTQIIISMNYRKSVHVIEKPISLFMDFFSSKASLQIIAIIETLRLL